MQPHKRFYNGCNHIKEVGGVYHYEDAEPRVIKNGEVAEVSDIEVGDVVSFTSIGEPMTSVVLSIWDQGYISHGAEDSIDGYLVRATVMNKGTVCNYPVKDLTIVRKWNESIPSEQVKQSDEMLTDKFIEAMKLAVKLIEGLTSARIVREQPRVHYFTYKGVIDTMKLLYSIKDPLIGDTYHVISDNTEYYWDGHYWKDAKEHLRVPNTALDGD